MEAWTIFEAKNRRCVMPLRFCLLLLISMAGPLRLAAQETAPPTLQGRVVDAKTGAPLAGAHVFLAFSTRGTTTDGDGHYRLETLPPGTHEIAASMLGYRLETRRVTLPGDDGASLDFQLEATVLQLGEVVVSSTRSQAWYEHLAYFEPLLLGHTPNASQCEVINPEVLVLDYDEAADHFRAAAHQALIVENRALGYRLFFHLKDFEAWEGTVRYMGVLRFEELPPRNRREQRRWARRRRAAYEGSPQHFFSTLYHAEDADEALRRGGFEVRRVPNFNLDPTRTVAVRPEALLLPEKEPNRRLLAFEDVLQVIHKAHRPAARSVEVPGSGPPTPLDEYASWITLNDGPTLLAPSGHLFDPYAVTMFGRWSRERIADALPRDYTPEP